MPDPDKYSGQGLILTTAAHFQASARGVRLLLSSESGSHVLYGGIYVDVAAALSQSISWNDLCLRLTTQYPLVEIQTAMTVLAQIGYVHPATPDSRDLGLTAWLESMGTEPLPRSVVLNSLCPVAVPAFEKLLQCADLSVSEAAPLSIVLTDDYLNPKLNEVNRHAKDPWLLAKLTGHTVWLGPLFTPGKSPCWECLAWWLRMHRWQEWGFTGGEDPYPQQPSLAHWPATTAIGTGMLAAAAARLSATGDHSEFQDSLLTFDTRTLVQARHAVRAVAGCAVCGPSSEGAPSDLRAFVSAAIGIVEQLEISSEAAAGLFHARARFVHALPTAPTRAIMRPGESFGKGASADVAGIACTAEAIERYSFAWRGSEAITLAKPEDIDGIPINDLGQYSATQFAHRADQAVGEKSVLWVPHRPPQEAAIGWVECRSLTPGAPRYVPAAAVYYAYPFETEQRYFVPDSNGCAAGRTPDDAIESALLELVERDALTIWWYNRLHRPSVRLPENDLDDLAHGILLGLREAGRSTWVLDLATDLGIPAYVALAPRHDGSDVVFGAAAHTCPQRAIQKALAEVSQIVYWKDRITPDPHLADWFRTAHIGAPGFRWLLPHGEIGFPRRRRLPAKDTVAQCASSLWNAGIACYCVDLTRPETRVPVVRAIAPGLRHPWRRFAPGRLYDVPVRMGWLKEQTPEADLNPIACTL